MSDFKAKISAALERIGHSNGHACPQSQDPIDNALHEYNVSSIGESHFKARRDKARKLIDKSMGNDGLSKLTDAKVSVKKTEISAHAALVSGAVYSLNAHVKNGASFLDTDKLKVKLLKLMDTDTVNKMFEECTDRRDPSVTLSVIELNNGE